MEASEIIQKIHEVNNQYIGWNVYQTTTGPQPNLKGRATYTRDAFWKEKIVGGTVLEILAYLRMCPQDFCVVFDEKQDKFIIFYLPAPFIGSKVLVQKIKVKQLYDDCVQLLQTEVSSEGNKARARNYLEALVEIPESLYGKRLRYKEGEEKLVKLGKKTLNARVLVPVTPFYR